MNWLRDITFRRDGGHGVEAVRPDGTAKRDIRFVQLFPLRCPGRYVSVIRRKSGSRPREELGVLRDLAELPRDQRRLVEEELRRSFFLPEIEAIREVIMAGGVDEWHVATDRGDKVLFVTDRKQSIRISEDGMIFVTDLDKCRYRIRRPADLDPLSRRLLDRAMA